jgi:ribosomal protein S18 acetylase RimI-like enzyme
LSSDLEPGGGFRFAADRWLGDCLGKPSWHVSADAAGDESLRTLAARGRLFAYAKVAAADVVTMRKLVTAGFYPVDVAVTYEGAAQAGEPEPGLRFARTADRDAVVRIAGDTFEFSRFHLDPQIPRDAANLMKAQWAGNFFVGARGDAMALAEVDGEVAAFLQLFHQPQETMLIDLVGVARAHQGRGIARRLIRFASSQPSPLGVVPRRVRVGTQIANTRSVRLYESLGLRLTDAQYVLHFHGR